MSYIRKNIVFILGSYYPNYSAVGKCLGNIADILEEDKKRERERERERE